MKCKAIINELADYLDEALDPGLRASIEKHLGDCKDCRIVVDTCQKTIQIFCNSEPAPLPEDTRERLHEALLRRLRLRKSKSPDGQRV
ncbi:MAG TPA: zf-HC2 domain-containing protein [Candidatus Baltobacteraceae bacterium]|nr:zf-HC2 domain-containing protein [Candidatus Baltobacteraceae bacterium]